MEEEKRVDVTLEVQDGHIDTKVLFDYIDKGLGLDNKQEVKENGRS